MLIVSAFYWLLIFSVFLGARRWFGELDLARTMAIQALVTAQVVYLISLSHASRVGWRHCTTWNWAMGALRPGDAGDAASGLAAGAAGSNLWPRTKPSRSEFMSAQGFDR